MIGKAQHAIALGVLYFLSTPAVAQERRLQLSPEDAAKLPIVAAGAGTSGLAAIETRVLLGDPSRPGPYTIAIRVPPNTRIAAHTHADDRTAVVAKGVWHFGYAVVAQNAASKELPTGSFYTEPANDPHFAWTGPEGATVLISGIGPSDTHYVGK